MHTTPDEQPNAKNTNTTNANGDPQAKGDNGAAGTTTPTVEDQLKDAQAKAAEYLDGWQRARADFANYRKRAEKEREEAYQIAAVEVLAKLLPVLDDFDLAVANVPSERAGEDVFKGFQMIHRKLMVLLENAGIKAIHPVGEKFNPAHHEALGEDPAGAVPAGHITLVLRKGYLYGERVLRAALVRVAS
jgi:molecular chaperone GrpE